MQRGKKAREEGENLEETINALEEKKKYQAMLRKKIMELKRGKRTGGRLEEINALMEQAQKIEEPPNSRRSKEKEKIGRSGVISGKEKIGRSGVIEEKENEEAETIRKSYEMREGTMNTGKNGWKEEKGVFGKVVTSQRLKVSKNNGMKERRGVKKSVFAQAEPAQRKL